jgi:hypothetical protein
MLTPKQALPVQRTPSFEKKSVVSAVQPSDVACTVCCTGCSLLPFPANAICKAGCGLISGCSC